jgi:hypothetical protein
MNGWRWLIVLGLSLVLAGPSRADVDLSGVYLLRPEHPARYRVTQTGTDVEISSDVDFGGWKRGEVLFKAKLAQGAGSSGRLVGAYKRDGAWVQAVLRFQVGATYRNFSIVTDVGGKLLDTVHSYDAGPKPPTLEFVDEQGKPTDPVAGFSQPAPTVKLDPVTRASLQVAGGVARFKLSGTVRSDLAEIVAGGRANITKVTIEYFSAPPDSKLVTVGVPVTVQAAAPPSGSRRPFAFSGRFSAQVAVPLADMGTHVAVRATDLTGGSGYDTITIRVRSQSWTSQVVNGTEVFRPAPPSAADVTEVVEGESTDPGAFHPVWLRIADPSAQPRTELEVGAQRVKVVKRDGERYAELPFIAVAGDPPGGPVNVVAAGKPLVVRYGQLEHKLGWATTPHSPPRIHAYPAGTEVNHVVEWDGFDAWEIQDVVPLRKEPRGPGFAWIADRDNVTVVERAVTSKRTARVRLRLGKHAW